MKPLTPEKAQKLIDTIRDLHTPDELLSGRGAPEQRPHSGALSVDGGSKAALERLFARARLGEHYWLEAIELCETKNQRRSLAREIAELAKAAASNIPCSATPTRKPETL